VVPYKRYMTVLTPGERLGAYVIVRMLGEGAMGLVYEARHEVLGRRAAIKVLRPELAQHPQVAPRFLQEARAANLVAHENVVGIFDFGETAGGAPYFVMEYLDGETLGARLRRGRLALTDLAHVFGQILLALEAAHRQGIVHRDLKPANVFLLPRATDPLFVKVLDFGVAKLEGEGLHTKTGMVLGTPVYMSPEQISGQRAGPRSDLFSVGVMLYEAATGELPFGGPTMESLAYAITSEAPPPPSSKSDVPRAFDDLVMTALAKDPAKRFADARAMLEALEALIPKKGAKPAAPRRRRSRVPLVAAAVLVLGGAGAVAAVMTLKPVPPASPDAATAAPTTSTGAAEILRAAVTSPDLGEAADAVAAIALAGGPRAAELLYPALDSVPELRRQAALALGRMEVPEAAARIRASLDKSSDRLRVELATVLAQLGSRDVVAILERGLDQPGTRLTAALGLVAAGRKDAGEPVLADVVESSPLGRDDWLRAAEGLLQLGDADARQLLRQELTQADAARAVAAAAILARAKDEVGRGFLERVVADASFSRRGEAAFALARLGDRRALAFVPIGLASAAAEDRRLAAAVAGALPDPAHRAALLKMMAGDADRRARLAAAAALLSYP
jgi:HEAT repeat protein/tRNA A-37 threonylcarbamoyl transferase component Bud32